MLTDSEKRWLHDRKLAPHPYCGWCMKYALCCNPLFTKCPTKTADLGDALEFEGRVTEKLAKFFKSYVKNSVCADLENNTLCPGWSICTEDVSKPHPSCDFSILKGVRLEVEEEMDANRI